MKERTCQYRIFIKFLCPDRDADEYGFQHMLTTLDEFVATRYIEEVMRHMDPEEFKIVVDDLNSYGDSYESEGYDYEC